MYCATRPSLACVRPISDPLFCIRLFVFCICSNLLFIWLFVRCDATRLCFFWRGKTSFVKSVDLHQLLHASQSVISDIEKALSDFCSPSRNIGLPARLRGRLTSVKLYMISCCTMRVFGSPYVPALNAAAAYRSTLREDAPDKICTCVSLFACDTGAEHTQ